MMQQIDVVDTSKGRLRGAISAGIHSFLGVPFAQPPIDELRWAAPQEVKPWTGVRDALEYGPCAMQPTRQGVVNRLIGIATHEVSEDCLYLNVWTPGCDDSNRPVMVWIHGGGNVVGAGSQPRIRGDRLAREGDVVVVTLNYRLGSFGFLHAPELGATGNEALLDQIAALNWVKDEIGSFGGNSNNVTVFGQSAGGFDIVQLMAMSEANGCFNKAIPMSGSLIRQTMVDSAHRNATNLAETFGGFDKVREVGAEKILDAQLGLAGASWGPVRDGELIREDAGEVLRRGDFTKGMPLMIGHTLNESTLFTSFNPSSANLSREGLLELVGRSFESSSEEVVSVYERELGQLADSVTPSDVWASISTDRMFRIPAIRTSECHAEHTNDVWMYRFDYPSPAHDGRLKACHSLDIPFVFGTYSTSDMQEFCGANPEIAELSERVMSHYLSFAHTDDPNVASSLEWPRYEESQRMTMIFDLPGRVDRDPMPETRRLFAS